MSFVGDVVSHACERVYGRDMGPHSARQQTRGDGEILVVRSDERVARRVRRGEARLDVSAHVPASRNHSDTDAF